MAAEPEQSADSLYFPVQLQTILVNSIRTFDVHIWVQGNMVLYNSKGDRFTMDVRNNLLANRITTLHILKSDRHHYLRYIEENLGEILKNPVLSIGEKTEIAHTSISLIAQSLFDNPRAQTILRYRTAISSTVDLIMKEEGAIKNLIRLTSHDFTTYIHSVNVGIFAIGLAKAILADDPSHNMNELACGFFLHDIGKCAIPLSVLNKPGPLTVEEWVIMRSHPAEGFALLEQMNALTKETRVIVMEHHERNDGSGYPRGLKGNQIHVYSKICCIADVFDALTAVRPYKQSKSPFQALHVMQDEMRKEFDPYLFEQFVLLFAEGKTRPAPRFRKVRRYVS
jgi:HD-GYP domain-containing protein (c-di-GMP phosphodiesterase class II)